MLSNQILQRTIHEMGEITDCILGLWNMDGKCLASSDTVTQELSELADQFIRQAEEGYESYRLEERCAAFVVWDGLEPAYIFGMDRSEKKTDLLLAGKLCVSQLGNLIRVMKERMDKNRFMQNLILDNLLLVDIYNQAKKLNIPVEKRRIVFLLESKDPKDSFVLEMIKGIYTTENGDFVTSVDEDHIILIKALREDEGYRDAENIAKTLVDVINTEAMANVRVAYGMIMEELKDVSKSYKEAAMALDVGRIFYSERSTLSYRELGIGRLIHQLPIPLCEMFLEEVFSEKAVEQFDEETLVTVDKFFENSLNISETARKLFVHRNTLVYRLEKIQRQTGLDVRNFEDALTFKIALMVVAHMRFLKEKDSR